MPKSLLVTLALAEVVEKDYSTVPRDDHGRWTDSGGTIKPAMRAARPRIYSEKAMRAIANYSPTNLAEQRAADHTEAQLSKTLGMPRTRDNSAFDLQSGKVGVEVKTMLYQKNDKITMKRDAIERKAAEIQRSGLSRTYTVVADKRGGVTKFYVSDRMGSLRLSTMTPVTLPQLRSMVRGRR